eukprot:g14221.t1
MTESAPLLRGHSSGVEMKIPPPIQDDDGIPIENLQDFPEYEIRYSRQYFVYNLRERKYWWIPITLSTFIGLFLYVAPQQWHLLYEYQFYLWADISRGLLFFIHPIGWMILMILERPILGYSDWELAYRGYDIFSAQGRLELQELRRESGDFAEEYAEMVLELQDAVGGGMTVDEKQKTLRRSTNSDEEEFAAQHQMLLEEDDDVDDQAHAEPFVGALVGAPVEGFSGGASSTSTLVTPAHSSAIHSRYNSSQFVGPESSTQLLFSSDHRQQGGKGNANGNKSIGGLFGRQPVDLGPLLPKEIGPEQGIRRESFYEEEVPHPASRIPGLSLISGLLPERVGRGEEPGGGKEKVSGQTGASGERSSVQTGASGGTTPQKLDDRIDSGSSILRSGEESGVFVGGERRSGVSGPLTQPFCLCCGSANYTLVDRTDLLARDRCCCCQRFSPVCKCMDCLIFLPKWILLGYTFYFLFTLVISLVFSLVWVNYKQDHTDQLAELFRETPVGEKYLEFNHLDAEGRTFDKTWFEEREVLGGLSGNGEDGGSSSEYDYFGRPVPVVEYHVRNHTIEVLETEFNALLEHLTYTRILTQFGREKADEGDENLKKETRDAVRAKIFVKSFEKKVAVWAPKTQTVVSTGTPHTSEARTVRMVEYKSPIARKKRFSVEEAWDKTADDRYNKYTSDYLVYVHRVMNWVPRKVFLYWGQGWPSELPPNKAMENEQGEVVDPSKDGTTRVASAGTPTSATSAKPRGLGNLGDAAWLAELCAQKMAYLNADGWKEFEEFEYLTGEDPARAIETVSDEQANDDNKARVARAHRSDRAKLAVTSRFGGVFFDATAILVERFASIVSNVAPVDVEKAFEESGEFAEIWGSFLEERALSYFVPEFREREAADTRANEEEKVAAPAFQGQDKFPGKEPLIIKPI